VSIIYNALQKTQKTLSQQPNLPRERKWIDFLLFLIIAILTFVVFFAYYPKIQNYFHKPAVVKKKVVAVVAPPVAPAPKPLVPTEMDYHGKLVLNGIFLSQTEKMALINNKPMHVGDVVEGKKIIDIDYNKVKLQDQSNILILRTIS
jgi:hypothetical protein